MRKEFPDAIYWIADLVTDAIGHGDRRRSPIPDALTTWRLTARAITADTRAGARHRADDDDEGRRSCGSITPRFLTEGDTVRVADRRRTTICRMRDRRQVSVAARTGRSTPAGDRSRRCETASASGERRHEWPFNASTVGTAVDHRDV